MTGSAVVGVRRSVRRTFEIYRGLLRAELQAAATYRAQLVLSFLSWTVPLAFLALWRNAASHAPVDGITVGQFSTYFTLILVTTSVQVTRPVIFESAWLVYSGELSARLLQPVHALHQIVAQGVAHNALRLIPLVAVVPVTLHLLGGAVSSDLGDWLLAGLVTILGSVACGYLAAISGALAFWMTKAQGVQGLLVGAEWILGGLIAPVGLLPGVLPAIVRHQPLWFADGAGPEILSGIGDHGAILVVEAVLWVVGLHLLFVRLWRRALVRYEAVGT